VPGGRSYIDGSGYPVAPPPPGGDRTAAPIERDGRDLGMLVYDASLDADPGSSRPSPPRPRPRIDPGSELEELYGASRSGRRGGAHATARSPASAAAPRRPALRAVRTGYVCPRPRRESAGTSFRASASSSESSPPWRRTRIPMT